MYELQIGFAWWWLLVCTHLARLRKYPTPPQQHKDVNFDEQKTKHCLPFSSCLPVENDNNRQANNLVHLLYFHCDVATEISYFRLGRRNSDVAISICRQILPNMNKNAISPNWACPQNPKMSLFWKKSACGMPHRQKIAFKHILD